MDCSNVANLESYSVMRCSRWQEWTQRNKRTIHQQYCQFKKGWLKYGAVTQVLAPCMEPCMVISDQASQSGACLGASALSRRLPTTCFSHMDNPTISRNCVYFKKGVYGNTLVALACQLLLAHLHKQYHLAAHQSLHSPVLCSKLSSA